MKLLMTAAFVSATVFGVTFDAGAQSIKNPELLVVNQGDASLSFVDAMEQKQTSALAEGVAHMVAHEAAVLPGGKIAFLPLYGDSGVGKPGTDGHEILVIDVPSQRIAGKVSFDHGVRPHCVLYDNTSGLLYVTAELDKAVAIIDPKTRTIVGTISTGQEQSHMLAISHDGRRGYTANVGPGTVSVLDLKSRKLLKVIPISATTQRISISNDDQYVFTSDQTKPRMAVINTQTDTVERWIDLPSLGYGSASTVDGRWLLVTLPVSGQLAVVDAKTLQVVRTPEIGPKPQEVVTDAGGTVAYVSCFGGHVVKVVDLKTWIVTKSIDVGEKADGMALVPPV